MVYDDLYREEPVVSERILDAAYGERLRAQWRSTNGLRIDEILIDGLASELAVALARLTPVIHHDTGPESAVSWRAELEIDGSPDPDVPAEFFRLGRFLNRDLPRFLESLLGQRLEIDPCQRIERLCKGVYRDDFAPDRLHFVLGLTGARWPKSWGGHLELASGTHPRLCFAPGWNTLDIFRIDGQLTARIPLLIRHVAGIYLHGSAKLTNG